MTQNARRGSVKGASGASIATKQIKDRNPLGPSTVLNSVDNAIHKMMEDDAVLLSECDENTPSQNTADVEALMAKASRLALALAKTEGELKRVRGELVESQSSVATAAHVTAIGVQAREVELKLHSLCLRDGQLRTQRDEARSEAARLQAELSRMQSDASDISREKAAIAEERLQFQATLAYKDKKLQAIQAQADAKVAQAVAEAEERVRNAEAKEELLRAELKAAKAYVTAAHADAETASSCGPIEEESEKDKLKRQLDERRAAVKAGEIRANQLEARLATMKQHLALAEKALKGQDAVILDLENQLSTTENELRKMREAAGTSSVRVMELEARVAELEKQVVDDTGAIESKDWRIEDLRCQVNELRDAIKDAESEKGAAQAALESTRERLADLAAQRTTDIEDGLKTLRVLEEEVSSLKAAAGRKELALRSAEEELAILRDSKTDTKKGTAALYSQVATLRAKIGKLESDLAKARSAAPTTSSMSAGGVEKRLVEVESHAAVAQAASATAAVEVSQLQAQIEEKNSIIAHLRNEITDAAQAYQGLRETFGRSAALESKVKELEEKLAEGTSDLESKVWRIDDLMHQIEELREALRENNGATEAAAAQERLALEQAHQHALATVQEVLEAQRVAAVEKVEEKLRMETSVAEENMKKLQERVDAAVEEAGKLREELQAVTAAGTKREAEVQRLTEERAALMEAVEALQDALKAQEERHVSALTRLQASQAELSASQAELKATQAKIAATEALIERLAVAKLGRDGSAGGKGAVNARQAGGKENGAALSPQKRGPMGAAATRNTPLKFISANAIY